MGVIEISAAGDRIRVHIGVGLGKATTPYEVTVPDPQILTETRHAFIIEDFPNHPLAEGSPALKAGMVTCLGAPIVEGNSEFYARIERRSKVLAGQLPAADQGVIGSLIRQAMVRLNGEQKAEAERIMLGAIDRYPSRASARLKIRFPDGGS
jgi:hypothetical protein